VACDIFREGEMELQSPVDLPEDLVTGQDNWYATLCYQCPEQEGILVRVMEGRAKKVRGNPLYPTNQGKQSARCEAGLQALYHPDRIATPLERKGPRGTATFEFQPIDWDTAMDRLRGQLEGLSDRNPLVMVTEPLRGHVGTVVERFVQAYGGRHMAFEPLDQTVLRTAVKQIFDQDLLPDFDIENSRYLLSFGADFLSTWVSPVRYARGYGEFRSHGDGKERGTFIHVEPRYSMTAANADRWIPIKPGMEGHLALSIAYAIIEEDLASDPAIVGSMSGGAGKDALLSAMDPFQPEKIAALPPDDPRYLGIPPIRGVPTAQTIRKIAREFADTAHGPSLAIGGGEAAAHTNGLFNLSAIYALNYLVGSVGRRPGQGGIVFNPPPPLADIPPSSKASSLSDWLTLGEDLRRGRVKVLMVHGANPVHGLASGVGFEQALGASDAFVVSFSSFLDDTTQMADLVLPERSYLEDWGDDMPEPGPGYRLLGMRQPVVNPLPELDPRSFPDMLFDLSPELTQELGLSSGVLDPFKALLRKGSDSLFELQRGSPRGGSAEAPTASAFWNELLQQGGWWDTATPSAALAPPPPNLIELVQQAAAPSFASPTVTQGNIFHLVPFLSNSLLDGRGAHLPWLQAAPDPLTTVTWQTWIEINSGKARDMGLKEGDVVRVVSASSSLEAIVYLHPAVPPDVVAIPVGQGHSPGLQYATKDGEMRGANIISILDPRLVDTETGAMAWAANRVLVQPTGENVKVSKFEGIVPAYPIGTREEDIVQVTGLA